MARESYIERESCLTIRRDPAVFAVLKIGWEGWPDRLVLFRDRRLHCWMEFKQLKGRLRAGQVERIRQMREAGEIVHEPRSIEHAAECFADAKRRLGIAPP